MNRTIRVERLYTLGDYKNIKVCDEITDIPEAIATDPEKVSSIYALLMAGCDLAYFRYEQMYVEHSQMGDIHDRSRQIKYLENLVGESNKMLNGLYTNGDAVESNEEH